MASLPTAADISELGTLRQRLIINFKSHYPAMT
jgi:hypothetical protein